MFPGKFALKESPCPTVANSHFNPLLPNKPRPKCFSSFRPHGAEGGDLSCSRGRENESTGNEVAAQD